MFFDDILEVNSNKGETMKNKLLALVLASGAFFSAAQAEFFIGVDAGYTAVGYAGNNPDKGSASFKTVSTSTISNAFNNNPEGFLFNLTLGTEHFFGKYFGLRWDAGLGYSSVLTYLGLTDKKYYIKHREDALVSVLDFDLIVNFVDRGKFSFGVFGGVGADHRYSFSSGVNSLGLVGRAGVTTRLGKNNRFEIFTKLPFATLAVEDDKGKTVLAPRSDVTVGASYKYIF